jgi:ribonuclease P protein component
MGDELSRKEGTKGGKNLPPKMTLKRLVKKEEAEKVFSLGRKVISDSFILYFLGNNSSRSAYAIHARKKLGMAVERNRVKRIFRAALYRLRDFLNGYDVIIVPRRKIKDLGFHQTVHQLEKAFFETGLSKKR